LPHSERQAAMIALHYSQSDVAIRALPHMLRAGDHALGIYALAQAEEHYNMARELAHDAEDAPLEARALAGLGIVHIQQG
ncbi:hypothetical protein ABTE36_23315, partial [Acinetobacter baumannii]